MRAFGFCPQLLLLFRYALSQCSRSTLRLLRKLLPSLTPYWCEPTLLKSCSYEENRTNNTARPPPSGRSFPSFSPPPSTPHDNPRGDRPPPPTSLLPSPVPPTPPPPPPQFPLPSSNPPPQPTSQLPPFFPLPPPISPDKKTHSPFVRFLYLLNPSHTPHPLPTPPPTSPPPLCRASPRVYRQTCPRDWRHERCRSGDRAAVSAGRRQGRHHSPIAVT